MKAYVISILASALICGIVELFLEKESVICKVVKLLGRVLIVVSLIAPLADITFLDITEYIDSINYDAEVYSEAGKKYAYDQKTEIIFSKLESYILDKAEQLQCDISVDITLSDDEIPKPNEVNIYGNVSPYAKEVLGSYIEDTLGIAREKQRWN